ncbi:MAG: hypothetical protein M9921_13590 [Fimbriimonadaceae bacterium]|nr:hypothetical protein [Fimbriimonadaceae bacterium]
MALLIVLYTLCAVVFYKWLTATAGEAETGWDEATHPAAPSAEVYELFPAEQTGRKAA